MVSLRIKRNGSRIDPPAGGPSHDTGQFALPEVVLSVSFVPLSNRRKALARIPSGTEREQEYQSRTGLIVNLDMTRCKLHLIFSGRSGSTTARRAPMGAFGTTQVSLTLVPITRNGDWPCR